MKNLLAAFVIIFSLASCSKQAPVADTTVSPSTSTLFFKDANLTIRSFTAATAGNYVQLNMVTLSESNISKLEIMSGETPNTLCSIYTTAGKNSQQEQTYNITDKSVKGNTMYYMIRYTLQNGDWGYTGLVKYTK
jgi:hypothetical protein